MIGRLADLFRLAWGLLYWNVRKWRFQLGRGRSACPCQCPSDSGRPLETRCEACVHWHQPLHFRRVCPLLVATSDGPRCSADTLAVRPFWGRAGAWYGGTLLALYLSVALVVFAFLRGVGYPISLVHLVWPASWHRVGQVRGWFFMDRANRSFAAGRTAEGMLYLRNAYEFDPGNQLVAVTYAQKLQLGQPLDSDRVYRRLLQDHPEYRDEVSRLWFRAMLARGDFAGVQALARARVMEDTANASVWMRALIFSTRATGDEQPLRELLGAAHAAAKPWRRLLATELLLRSGRRDEARRALAGSWGEVPLYALFYQIHELVGLGEGIEAADLVETYGGRLDDTARATLLLDAYASLGAPQSLQRLIAALLAAPLNLPTANLLCAHLVRHPNPAAFDALYVEFQARRIPFDDRSIETYLAMYCTAGVAGDWPKMEAIATALRPRLGGNARTIGFTEAFFRGQTTQTRIASVLPALPLSLEMTYALLERYPGPQTHPAFPPP